jgi:hypothetical protein
MPLMKNEIQMRRIILLKRLAKTPTPLAVEEIV